MQGGRLGPFRLDAELGAGGMGRVWRATALDRVPGLAIGARVALKVLHPHLMEKAGYFKRFLREVEMGKRVLHRNVVRTFDLDAALLDGVQQHFFVMEHVEGQTLRSLLAELGRVPEELCRHVGAEVANGLVAIHAAGIVHRDLKPENVLVTRDNAVKVMDLGVARLVDEQVRLSQSGAFVGSILYAAPEQFQSMADVDGRTDLHGLGLLLYELATGVNPYGDDDFRVVMRKVLHEPPRRIGELNPQLSPFFEEVVHTLLAKNRDARFATAALVARVLADGEADGWWRARASSMRTETKRPLRRIRIPRETALVGRDAELARLRALYDRAASGDGQVVLIEGEAGIGKTRLVDEFVSALRQAGEDVNFLFGSYPPGGAATAAGAFATAFREQFGDQDLERTLAGYLGASEALAPAFAALLSGMPAPRGDEPLTKDALQTCFVHATRALAAERPTIVLIDDLHFAPEEGRALFAALVMAVPGHRVLLCGTSRSGVSATWKAEIGRMPQTTLLPIERLGPKDLTALLVDAFHSRRLAEELGFEIAEKSDGNPYFVFEILHGLRNAKLIVSDDDGRWVSTARIDAIRIPATLEELIRARTLQLDPESKDLLELASCCGFEFDPLVVAEAAGLERTPALKLLARIEAAHRLVRSAGRRFVFDHHQVQEALYLAIPELLREEYHGALAEALERRSGAAGRDPQSTQGDLARQICSHFLAAGRADRALRYLDAALQHLEHSYLSAEVIRLVDRALAAPGVLAGTARVDALVRKARALDLLGRKSEQAAAIEQAIAFADADGDAGDRARTRRLLGWYQLSVDEPQPARTVLLEALELACQGADRRLEADITANLGSAALALGDDVAALGHYRRSLAMAEALGARDAMVTAHGSIGRLLRRLGRHEDAARSMESCLALSRELGRRRDEAAATVNYGVLLLGRGRLAEALERQRCGLSICTEIGFRLGEATALASVAAVLRHLGRADDALPAAERSIELNRAVASRSGESGARIERAESLLQLGRREEAVRELEGALAAAEDVQSNAHVALARLDLGRVAAASERHDEAGDHFRRALVAASAAGDADYAALARAHLAALPAQAVAETPSPYASRRGVIGWAARIEVEYVLWKATRSDAHLSHARRLLDLVRAGAPAEDRQRMVDAVPLHREVMAASEERFGRKRIERPSAAPG